MAESITATDTVTEYSSVTPWFGAAPVPVLEYEPKVKVEEATPAPGMATTPSHCPADDTAVSLIVPMKNPTFLASIAA